MASSAPLSLVPLSPLSRYDAVIMTAISYQTPGLGPSPDRSTRLLVVGIFLLIAACFIGLATLMMPVGMMMSHRVAAAGTPAPAAAMAVGQMLATIALYALLTVGLVMLGVGAIRKRRWFRPIILVLAWLGLMMGIAGVAFVAFMLPDLMQDIRATTPPPPPGAAGPPAQLFVAIIVITTSVSMLLYVGVPALLIFLFKGADVQATLEFYDPVPRWTDGVPIPVLGLCGILGFGAIWAIMMAIQGMVPAFGVFLHGIAARLALVAVAVLFAYAALQVYKLRLAGWRVAVVLLIVVPLAAAITFARGDVGALYRDAGVPPGQMQRMTRLAGPAGAIWAGLFGIGAIAYALRVKKYFSARDANPITAAP
jgi:hypothetical protein